MAERTPREVIDAYVDAMDRGDWALLRELFVDDYIEDYPQSGERIRGADNAIHVRSSFPRADMAAPPSRNVGAKLIVGGEDHWALAPNFTAIRVAAAGVTITAVTRAVYPDGPWYVVYIGTVDRGRIRRATAIFGATFEPAPWRAAWVERIPEAER